MEMIVNREKHRMDGHTNGRAAERSCWQLCERASACVFGWRGLMLAIWRSAAGLIGLLYRLISLLSLRKAVSAYTGPRTHPVRCMAAGWGGSSSSRHPLAKPGWVKAAVLQLAQDLPNAGCRTLSNSFNLAHAPSGQRISKTWVASLQSPRGCIGLSAAQIAAYAPF
jgi:hypothetical protein